MEDLSTEPLKEYFVFGEKISMDEDREHEFKALQFARKPEDQIVDYCKKYLNAFLNTEGGKLYFGIEDDGTIYGIPANRKLRDHIRLLIDNTLNTIKPQVDPHLIEVDFVPVRIPMRYYREGKRRSKKKQNSKLENGFESEIWRFVVRITIQKGRAPVYFTHGKAYFRLSGSVRRMSEELIEERKRLGRPIDGKLSSVPKDFIGREEEIQNIREFISTSDSNVVTVLLYGLPVVGKSTLARRLVWEFSSMYSDRHFFDRHERN